MKLSSILRPLSLPLGIVLLTFSVTVAVSQQTPPATGSSNSVLSQLATAFSGGQVVQQVQLTGSATWTAGSLQDTGTAVLTASSTGSFGMQLALANTGTRVETETGLGENADCQWAGADGLAHEVSKDSCWRPAIWFLPAMSLQPPLLEKSLTITDLGTGTVGADTSLYRHVQGHLVFSDLPATISSIVAQESMTDLGLDPQSLLPAVLAYSVHPDNGASVPIAIEIHYSDYRAVNGVQIPFIIQRYVNGSLQLQISVTAAQIS